MMQTQRFSKDWLLKMGESRPEKRTEYKDQDNRYLRLIVHPSGKTKLCVYKCPRGQRSAVRVALPFSVNSVMPNMQRIRGEASQIVALLDQGINPNDDKPSAHTPLTLHKALDNYLLQSTNTNQVITNWRKAVETHLSTWLDKQLIDLCSPQQIYSKHRHLKKQIAASNLKRGRTGDGGIAANETMKKLRRILNFNRALDKAYSLPRWPSDQLGPNGLKMWIEQKPRTRRVHKEEFPIFWEALHQLECPIQRDLFKFILLTGCRSSEARKLTHNDIDMHRWAVTFKDTKNGLDLTLPLTQTLKTIVLERISMSTDNKIFALAEPKTVTKHIERYCGLHKSPHDLRRTFAGAAEAAGIGSTIKKDLLNHLSGRDVTDDYTGKTDFDDLRLALDKIEAKILAFSSPR